MEIEKHSPRDASRHDERKNAPPKKRAFCFFVSLFGIWPRADTESAPRAYHWTTVRVPVRPHGIRAQGRLEGGGGDHEQKEGCD